jgi:hypothetical protein
LQAVRLVQIEDLGGDKILFWQWWQTLEARRCHSAKRELFWQQVLQWLIQHRENDPRLRSGNTLIDIARYLRFKRQRYRKFSIKGRSKDRILEDMELWQQHQDILRLKREQSLPGSGFLDLGWHQEVSDELGLVSNVNWQMREILSKVDLFNEGKTMRHCVYTYRGQIDRGNCSIWTLTANGQKCVTIELNNKSAKVVQMKGKGNRHPHKPELVAIGYWARENGIAM